MPDAGVPEASLRALGGAVGQFIVIRFANYLLASSIATGAATVILSLRGCYLRRIIDAERVCKLACKQAEVLK